MCIRTQRIIMYHSAPETQNSRLQTRKTTAHRTGSTNRVRPSEERGSTEFSGTNARFPSFRLGNFAFQSNDF